LSLYQFYGLNIIEFGLRGNIPGAPRPDLRGLFQGLARPAVYGKRSGPPRSKNRFFSSG
jgi:hypothetical protein